MIFAKSVQDSRQWGNDLVTSGVVELGDQIGSKLESLVIEYQLEPSACRASNSPKTFEKGQWTSPAAIEAMKIDLEPHVSDKLARVETRSAAEHLLPLVEESCKLGVGMEAEDGRLPEHLSSFTVNFSRDQQEFQVAWKRAKLPVGVPDGVWRELTRGRAELFNKDAALFGIGQ